MGLDAYVRCTCWEEGKTKPAPVKREHIIVDEETDELDLDLPWEGHQNDHAALQQWLENCCPHPNMRLVWQRISNWAGVRHLQAALRDLGDDAFPHLLAAIPNTNGGRTEPGESRLCIEELARFEQLAPFGRRTNLVDATSGALIQGYIADYGGVFAWLGREGLEFGVDPAGFFITDSEGTEFFRAREFDQLPHEAAAYTFLDLESGTTFVSPKGVSYLGPDGLRDIYPKRLKVVSVYDSPDNYKHEIDALRKVFEASVASGRPVVWC